MELEIGLKITKTKDDGNLTTSNLRIAKDANGPVFVSSETESWFVLTAHLKGYRRERIKIDINEDGTLISISGDKTIQEMVMVRWTIYKKEVEITGFKKVFRIPNGVKLNKIKARFNQEKTMLSIFMPKLKKGIQGVGIEEVTEVVEKQEEEKVVEEAVVVQENESEKPEIEFIEKKELESRDIPDNETKEISRINEEIPDMLIQEDQEKERIETRSEEVVQEPMENEIITAPETVFLKEEEVEEEEEIQDETSFREKEEEIIEETVKQEDLVEDTSVTPVEPVEEPLKLEHEEELVEEVEETIDQQLQGEEMQNHDGEETSIENKATSPTDGTNPWLRYPFGVPSGFIVGSTLFGLLIALVVHFLSENKKLKKYGTS
ncbi:hypothetical protein MKX01_009947 [Papaver californicum]|nr:hypothetical protein MKX01_009947 [Papaver californicum]